MRDAPVPATTRGPGPGRGSGRRRRPACKEARRPDRQGAQPRAGPRRHDHRGPAAHPRRRRVGQDPGPRPPDRLPRRRQGRRPVADPRGHLHEPRRRRAPRADHQPRRRGRARRPGRHVPLALRAACCARDGEAIGIGRRFVIYDTDDQQRPDEADPARGGPAAHRRVPPERRPRRDQPGQERDARPDVPRRERASNHRERTIARLATRYQERLRKANALDFDDLLLEAVRLFDEAPDVLASTRIRWRYLHVDEYQDTNRAQYLWVRRARRASTATSRVVGDDDQSIYSWRGADLRNILDFERDWPDTRPSSSSSRTTARPS